MKIKVYECPICNQKIYSRAHYDFRRCKCMASAVDGGYFDEELGVWFATRLIGSVIKSKRRIIDIDVTPEQLYDDWNKSVDKYGVIEDAKRE